MSQSYYYLVASLPSLQYGIKAPFTLEDFLKDAQRLLTVGDFAQLQRAMEPYDEKTEPRNPLARSWHEFEHNLRNELAWFRAGKAQKDPLAYIRGQRAGESYLVNLVAEAAELPNPLTAEQLLDKARWQKLEELAAFHYFDLEVLIVYALRLQILERHQAIETSKGQERYYEYKKIENPALK